MFSMDIVNKIQTPALDLLTYIYYKQILELYLYWKNVGILGIHVCMHVWK